MDKGVEYEQNLKRRSIAIMILRAKSNRLVDLLRWSRIALGKWARSERARLFEVEDEVVFLYAFCMQ